eukprot:1159509-Pelagomonas_calceolata.AAC.16
MNPGCDKDHCRSPLSNTIYEFSEEYLWKDWHPAPSLSTLGIYNLPHIKPRLQTFGPKHVHCMK